MEKCVAIVLAAGSGKRMQSDIPKQYLPLAGKPILYYSLKAFEESFIDEIVLVTAENEIEYCRREIIEKFQFKKVSTIAPGGAERYHSVWNGIAHVKECDYLFIHDGARPFLTREILQRAYECVKSCDACVAAMPVKDTIKQIDETGTVVHTPRRDTLYQMQTPQTFRFDLIKKAYAELIDRENEIKQKGVSITDDAMVVETMAVHPVKVFEGAYTNMKITTPEDILAAQNLLEHINAK